MENPKLIKSEIGKIDYREIIRPQMVYAIGDLNGSLYAYYHNLKALALIDSAGNWIGKDGKLVFLGDILADRNRDSIEIMERIENLKLQAKSQGGNVEVLAGNHEDFAISYLMRRCAASLVDDENPIENTIDPLSICFNETRQGIGLLDIIQLSGYENPIRDGRNILKKLKKNKIGLQLLNQICEMKIFSKIDDTLFSHCPITAPMIEMIYQMGISEINSSYQAMLKRYLLDEEPKPTPNDPEDLLYEVIRSVFLSTENRTINKDSQYSEMLKNIGINFLIYGHNGSGGKATDMGAGLYAVDIDYGTYKKQFTAKNTHSSVARIDKEGVIQIDNMDRQLQIRPGTKSYILSSEERIDFDIKGIIASIKAMNISFETLDS